MRKKTWLLLAAVALLGGEAALAQVVRSKSSRPDIQPSPLGSKLLDCALNTGLCTELGKRYISGWRYSGHDEPSLIFYSSAPGAGNTGVYLIILPTDPPTAPLQDGTGGTFNFQLYPSFWVGMALCDTQSYPNYTSVCVPDSDSNIYDSPDATDPHYIGHHPGTAFLELQFYPPGWVDTPYLIDASQWLVAINIDSDGESLTQENNPDCLNDFGGSPESVNFAFITRDGIPLFPPNPLGIAFPSSVSRYDLSQVLTLNPGDVVVVVLRDTSQGLRVTVNDLTTGASGAMTASAQNGFGQVVFDPNAKTCSVRPYSFHPMYSTSTVHTRVPWAAHSYNTAFSDEIGHFEYCDQANAQTLNCTQAGVNDKDNGDGLDADDALCLTPSLQGFPPPPFIQIGGCTTTETDFDGVSYQKNWPGTFRNADEDFRVHPTPIRLMSPLFRGPNGLENYSQVGFETDLPGIEYATHPACNQRTGEGCANPPPRASFYPFYSTTTLGGVCFWQLGGDYIPGTTNDFGGSPQAAFGSLVPLVYATSKGGSVSLYEDFRRILSNNPCPAPAALR